MPAVSLYLCHTSVSHPHTRDCQITNISKRQRNMHTVLTYMQTVLALAAVMSTPTLPLNTQDSWRVEGVRGKGVVAWKRRAVWRHLTSDSDGSQ